jgi:hypothetical protein
MNTNEARAEFDKVINKAIQSGADKQKIAELEVIREYLCNPEFKGNLQEFTAMINGHKG